MSHIQKIKDTDRHFMIDPIQRAISTESAKLVITQGDHNSERYTFEVPRYVEEHDMSESTRIEVHYDNFIRTKKEINSDTYPVPTYDMWATRDKVYFSWLVSGNATKLVGSLTFSVTFICRDSDTNEIVYQWSTGIFESISVVARHNNTSAVIETYPDLYEQMKQDIIHSAGLGNGGSGNGGNSGSDDSGDSGDDEPDNPGGNGGGSSSDGVIDNVVDFDGVKPPNDDEFDNTVEF